MSGNVLLTIGMITREALAVLVNELTFTKRINRKYEDYFAKSGAKIGQTLNVRVPPRYIVAQGAAINMQGSVEGNVPVTLNQRNVAMSFTSADLTLSIDDFSERFIKPAVCAIANQIDYDGLQLWQQVYNAVGTPGTTPTDLQTYLNAGALMNYQATPKDDRSLCLNPTAEATIVNSLKTIFNPTREISDQYTKGSMGSAIGFEWYMDQNIGVQTVGTYSGTPLTNGVTLQNATTLVTNGWGAASFLNIGDIFTVAGVNLVNPQNRQNTGLSAQFVVNQLSTADGSGNMTISFAPAMIAPVGGLPVQFQNITALPAASAAISVLGASGVSSPQNLAFQKDSFTFVCVDMEELPSLESSRATAPELGMSIRVTRAGDVVNDRAITRLDILYGFAALYPQTAVRIAG